jgi:uncharacterized protein involved in exopolysaccharide biosynthesis
MAIAKVFEDGRVVNQDLIDLYDFFGALRKRKWLIAAIALACMLGAGGLAVVMKPVYRAYAVLDPVTQNSNPLTSSLMSSPISELGSGLAAITGGTSDADRDTDEAMTVLSSREFTQKFIDRNDLLPVLFPKSWDSQAGRWKAGRKIPSLARGYVEFDRIRKVDRNYDNDFVTLQIDWPDRIKAAEWTNQMVQMLNEELRTRALAAADASLSYLRDEWAKTDDAETREAISRLIGRQLQKKMLATVTPEFELRFVDRAVTPDADFPQRPNKILMIAIGLVFGWLLGVVVALILYRRELAARGDL